MARANPPFPGCATWRRPGISRFRLRSFHSRPGMTIKNAIALGMQSAPVAAGGGYVSMSLVEQFGELFGDGAAELFGVDDGDGAAIVARDVVANADRDQLDRRAGLDLLVGIAQMGPQVVAGIDRQRGIVDRRSVGNYHQGLASLGVAPQ